MATRIPEGLGHALDPEEWEQPVRLRRMAKDDVLPVLAIENIVFSTPWQENTFVSLLDREDSELWVADAAGAVVGYAVLWFVLEQGELGNLAVAPDLQGRGIGARLLDRVISVMRYRGVERLFLEVRASNDRAFRLYESRGFGEIGVRRRYYQEPMEDAKVLMKRLVDIVPDV